MKRLLSLCVVLLLLFSLAACLPKPTEQKDSSSSSNDSSSSEESLPPDTSDSKSADSGSPTPKQIIDGYVYYEGMKNNKKFQYPESWVLVNSDVLDNPESQSIFSDLGLSEADLETALTSITAILYNFDRSTDSFSANMNFSELDAANISSTAMLTNPLSLTALKGQVENQLVAFDSMEWVEEPQAKTYGDVDTLSYTIDYSYLGNDVRLYTVQFVQEDIMYVFTYTIPVEFASTAGEEIESIIGSFE